MARKPIDIGTIGNDGTGDSIRDAFRKVNDNFRELYSSLGLGEKLRFTGLDDTPNSYLGQADALVSVNKDGDRLIFKRLEGGQGIRIDYDTNEELITLNNELANISADIAPNLGGALNAQFGLLKFPIGNLPDLRDLGEIQKARTDMQATHGNIAANPDRLAANKGYVDTKLSLAGIDSTDPATGGNDPGFGIMTGPLVLSRDPIPEDDDIYGGRTAATKRYVDGAGFGSRVNLFVATSGQDERSNITRDLQGRALSFAYRTIEAALKRAEELILESPIEIGPYKKVLTYDNGRKQSTLKLVESVENSGSGFAGTLKMSVETLKINNPGSLYRPGDILTLVGGTSDKSITSLEVLAVRPIPGLGGRGPISSFRLLTSGVYTSLPGSTNIATDSPNTDVGSGATFDVTYVVNGVTVTQPGSNYGLVSVRIVGGGGKGAFGRADIVNGEVVGITITNKGSGFTSLPQVLVNLPRFFIETEGFRTDFTGNLAENPEARRTRDIREGLLLRGETSGALAQILSHTGQLSEIGASGSRPSTIGCEIFDVDLLSGEFLEGEVISYGDVTKPAQICVFIEAGIYEENYPLRVPQNVAVIGDEFRRTIIKPKGKISGVPLSAMSTSPWAGLYFRRDKTFDGMQVADTEFGYHYLRDPKNPVYPLINNRGLRRSTADLIDLNRDFIRNQIIGWINNQIALATFGISGSEDQPSVPPDTSSDFYNFTYDREICRRDIGLIIDAMMFDLRYGGHTRTVSSALKYFTNASSLKAITEQKQVTMAGIQRINLLLQDVIENTEIITLYTLDGDEFTEDDNPNGFALPIVQTIDRAYVSESGSSEIITALTSIIIDIISGESTVLNLPKNNDQMDIFLCNDANIIRAVTAQGHGGFMMVLDPEGQILTKSPYCQESAAFSKSTGFKTFAGGMFVDGFTGNQEFRIKTGSTTTLLEVDGLLRIPNTPCSFIVNDVIYRINYVRNYNYAIDYPTTASDGKSQWYSSAQFILDETTPWPFGVFDYNDSLCFRDVGLIIEGLGYDLVFGTNYHQRKSGYLYLMANASVVFNDQLNITIKSISFAHEKVIELLTDADPEISEDILEIVRESDHTISLILKEGENYIPPLVLPDPPSVNVNLSRAKTLLLANIDFLKDETLGWVNTQISLNIPPFNASLVYDSVRWSRDIVILVEALAYDIIYGGDSQTIDVGKRFYDGIGNSIVWQRAPGQQSVTAAAVNYLSTICQNVVLNQNPSTVYSSTPRVTGTPASSTQATSINGLLSNVSTIIISGVMPLDNTIILPNLGSYQYPVSGITARSTLISEKINIQNSTIFFVNLYGNAYQILMPGNRSMLSNDFTQIADLGYGLVVVNGGLTEAVSMFTYYCQISYYAVTGGQIRSIGGSSSHGNYALVAEGSDPLEVPKPVSLYKPLAQGASIFASTISTINKKGDVVLSVIYDDYLPLSGSELEINHGNIFTRYEISSVESIDVNERRVRLGIASAGGIEAGIPHGQRVVIRMNSFVVLTGDVVDVATRPSTALVLKDGSFVYRVLEFNDYDQKFDKDDFVITSINLNTGVFTTNIPHKQIPGYQIKIEKTASDTLPSSIDAKEDFVTPLGQPPIPPNPGTVYYISSVLSATTFTISGSKNGPTITFGGQSSYNGAARLRPYGLALTQLRENYSYIVYDLVIQPFQNPNNLKPCSFVGGQSTISSANHGLKSGNQIRFQNITSGLLPGGIENRQYYWVVNKDLTQNTFKLTNLPPLDSTQIGVGATITDFTITGLVSTTRMIAGMRLIPRSNISIISVSGDGTVATLTIPLQPTPPFMPGQEIRITGISDAGFNTIVGTPIFVVSCTTTTIKYLNSTVGSSSGGSVGVPIGAGWGSVGTDARILTVVNETTITISNNGGSANGKVVFGIDAEEIIPTSSGNNVGFGFLLGDQGQTVIAVSDLPLTEEQRVENSKMVFEGTEYTIIDYQEKPNEETFSLITLDKPLDISAIKYVAPIAMRSGVNVPSEGSLGTLTIRIALVRVTSHDFLEIGTGSYADTNYPNDIFGPAVNDFASVALYTTEFNDEGARITRSQVQERGVGRAFFVTTDQFGNFSVGPFFKVDQGTGTVTFAASIALSQLDGLGFKRGATISEFSVDDTLSDAANNAVPTEGAVRSYIEKRLGLSHEGVPISQSNLIPPGTNGGFMALTGQLAMKGPMNLGGFKIINIGPPTLSTDVARLDSLIYNNLKDNDGSPLFSFANPTLGQLVVLSGDDNNMVNVNTTGDVIFSMSTANLTNKVIVSSISPGVIVNADISGSAAIDQSKLNLKISSARAQAPTGNASQIQDASGLSTVDSAQFTVTNGWITIKDNGLTLSKLQKVAGKRLLGNTTSEDKNIDLVTFPLVVDEGGGVKKSQYSSVGYLKRINSNLNAFTDDGHYSVVNDDAQASNNTLVRRDGAGSFAGNSITATSFRVTVETGGAYEALKSTRISATNGTTDLLSYNGPGGSSFAGVQIGAGDVSDPQANRNIFNNTLHEFRSQNGLTSFATLNVNGLDLGARTVTAASLTGCTSISTGGQTIGGTITGRWTLTGDPATTGSRFQATYAADLAEYYEGDKEYEVGTVLVFGGEKEVTISESSNDTRVAGVVSDTAAYSMYGACPGHKNLIALQGRVPCRVVGKINKGDILVTSSIPGVAMAANNSPGVGTVVGKAIETYDSDQVGTIQVAVGRT